MRAGFFQRLGQILSRVDRLAERASLSTHPSSKEKVKHARLDPSSPGRQSKSDGDSGRQYQQEGDLDAHFSPQEGLSSDYNPSKPGGAIQPDSHIS